MAVSLLQHSMVVLPDVFGKFFDGEGERMMLPKTVTRLWIALFLLLGLSGSAAVYSQLKPNENVAVVYQDPT